ncbi:hypothetical protein Natpe_4104 (plasmid) [Natrinema pellirubrum DSM 15624]|uniref:Uncharacterized protein n=1 Tax=Natrinema pellirubrum (strain DSM 15624 / CIP 106293 / JCM 10476 / NCIMB 786 / 157) TaxID=797303 RepID=L0JRH4_NATP1|nr:hypothetical protein Natpe_4104 [Natrinema pellirubrum DSM 15624]
MVETENLDHPAVEVTLPVDREHHQYEVPQHTTLFFWTTLAAGTPERLPQIQSPLGSCLFNEICNSREQMTWSVSINGESVPLLTDERVIESVTYEAAGCGKCVQHNRDPARRCFGR